MSNTGIKGYFDHIIGSENVLIVYTPERENLAKEFIKAIGYHPHMFRLDSPKDDAIKKITEYARHVDAVTTIMRMRPDETEFRVRLLDELVEYGNVKIAHGPGISKDMIPLFDIDYEKTKKFTRDLIEELERKDVKGYHIESESGTDLYVRKDAEWVNEFELKEGSIGNIPPGEIYMQKENFSKLYSNGIFVSDFGAVPAKLTIRNGFVKKIEADSDVLDIVKEYFGFYPQENMKGVIVQELGWGILGKKVIEKYREPLVQEKGGIHLGVGPRESHLDFLTDPDKVSVSVVTESGEELIYENGKFLIG